MATSPERIRAILVNRTNADCSEHEAKNNRYHYFLKYEQSIGWDWLYKQVDKASVDSDTDLELYKIRPSGLHDFEVEVRELARREGIDSSQRGLTDFEEPKRLSE